jgi:hypothetical protein
MREVSRHLFIPRRPLIASMLSSDPERNWIRIVNASLISSTRPALISASAPFAMTRRFPLPARRSFASIDRVMGSISGLWLPPPASSAAATFARLRRFRSYRPRRLSARQCPGRGFSSRRAARCRSGAVTRRTERSRCASPRAGLRPSGSMSTARFWRPRNPQRRAKGRFTGTNFLKPQAKMLRHPPHRQPPNH